MTDKLNGIKPGDRVRVEFEGVVTEGFPLLRIHPDGCKDGVSWWPGGEERTSSFQITRIEPELAVGDMVTWGTGVLSHEIVAIKEKEWAVLWSDEFASCCMQKIGNLRRVPAK